MGFFSWLFYSWRYVVGGGWITSRLGLSPTQAQLDAQWAKMPDWAKNNDLVKWAYEARSDQIGYERDGLQKSFEDMIAGQLQSWVEYTKTFGPTSPADAEAKLAEMSAKIIEIFSASAAVDIGLGMLPNGAGQASSTNTKQLLKWLGFGAVLAAIAHDPVKIGLLRPYQDNLEATFRNRRPDWKDMLKAYQQRSLSQTQITDISQITDPLMDQIEAENSTNLDSYGATWGYDQKWINIMKDAETRALTFGNLGAMARLGQYDRKLAIFSLWTYGLDRRLMYPALTALESMRDVGLYKGFRSMVEPGYVQGLIEETDVRSYWSKILVPQDVQDWAMPRLMKSREKFLAKEAKTLNGATRDLTKADWTKTYQLDLIDLPTFESKLSSLGYDVDEVAMLVKLADAGKKAAKTATCKKLPLSDYELAHRNGILTLDQVLARMQGEYCQADIDLERQLLEISDLTSNAPAKERDLTVSQLTQAYVDSLTDSTQLTASLTALGFDAAETSILVSFADQKKTIAAAKAAKSSSTSGVLKERDLTLAQLTQAYVQNVIDESAYTADLTGLGYDPSETAILLKLAQIKKKLPSLEGLKRLPLSDYEKAWKYGALTADQVIARMQGEYTAEDIQLERLLISIGKP